MFRTILTTLWPLWNMEVFGSQLAVLAETLSYPLPPYCCCSVTKWSEDSDTTATKCFCINNLTWTQFRIISVLLYHYVGRASAVQILKKYSQENILEVTYLYFNTVRQRIGEIFPHLPEFSFVQRKVEAGFTILNFSFSPNLFYHPPWPRFPRHFFSVGILLPRPPPPKS